MLSDPTLLPLPFSSCSYTRINLKKSQSLSVSLHPSDGGSLIILLGALAERSHLWFHVGLVLGLNYGRLRNIQSNNVSTEDCLVKTLNSWLSLRDRVQRCGQPSWRTLTRALAHPLVGELRLAEEIAEKHKAAEVHNYLQ